MLNVCPACGAYRAAKIVVDTPPSLICPACGAAHPFVRRPLFILSGAGGTGKTTVTLALQEQLPNMIVLDTDILWAEEFHPPAQWPKYFDLWLRLAKNLGAPGRPVLLTGAGFGVPANLVNCVEARYFSAIRIFALICAPAELARRLHNRPAWRNTRDPGFVDDHVQYNQWFLDQSAQAGLPIDLFDTTYATLEETVHSVIAWVNCHTPLNLSVPPLSMP